MVKQVGLFGRPAAEESPQPNPRAPRKAKARKVAEGNRLPWAKASDLALPHASEASGEGELPSDCKPKEPIINSGAEPTSNTSIKPTEDDPHGEQGESGKQG